jgi:GMP synthase (glutamine-hydrolysing)
MKPVLILQHLSADGPGYLGQWLQAQGVPTVVCNSEAGHPLPTRLTPFSALAILGGEMSANDDLAPLRQAEALFLQALSQGTPTLGHCLGGQLMARALGARVSASPAPEIGWQPVQIKDSPTAQQWFGEPRTEALYQWHYEAFEVPPGAELLASSPACPHQAFAIGPHLAMQFHIEVDPTKVLRWSEDTGARYTAVQHHESVQTGPEMRGQAAARWRAHHALADRIYTRWMGLAHQP